MGDFVSKPVCLGRREFLVKTGLIGGAMFLTVSTGMARPAEDIVVPIAADGPLAKAGGFQVIDSPAGKIIVIRKEEQKFVAYSAVCTHKRGVLTYENGAITCPKHGSKFDATSGNVAAGPAETALKAYQTKAGDGSVTVVV